MDIKKFLTDEKLESLFSTFDVENTGQISPENIKNAFTKFGRELSDEEVEQIMKEHDVDGNQYLDKAEFKNMMIG